MKYVFILIIMFIFSEKLNAAVAVEPVVIRTLTTVTGGGLSVTGSSDVATLSTFASVYSTTTVSGGTGSSTFSITGSMASCSIVPPSSISIYDFDLTTNDSDEFPIMGRRALVGKVGLTAKRFLLGDHKVTISNASPDGTYKTRCVIIR